MFGRTILMQGRKESVPYEKTVVEKRAPTDESVKLLQEMQEKAHKSLLASGRINNTLVDAVYVVRQDSNYMKDITLSIRFKINGTECIHDIDLGCVMIKTVDIQKRIYELISDKITRLVYHKLMVANKGNLI